MAVVAGRLLSGAVTIANSGGNEADSEPPADRPLANAQAGVSA